MAKLTPTMELEKLIGSFVTVERANAGALQGGVFAEDMHTLTLDITNDERKTRNLVIIPKVIITGIWAEMEYLPPAE